MAGRILFELTTPGSQWDGSKNNAASGMWFQLRYTVPSMGWFHPPTVAGDQLCRKLIRSKGPPRPRGGSGETASGHIGCSWQPEPVAHGRPGSAGPGQPEIGSGHTASPWPPDPVPQPDPDPDRANERPPIRSGQHGEGIMVPMGWHRSHPRWFRSRPRALRRFSLFFIW